MPLLQHIILVAAGKIIVFFNQQLELDGRIPYQILLYKGLLVVDEVFHLFLNT